jgi:hypothetical protein
VKAWYAKGLGFAFQAKYEEAIRAFDAAIRDQSKMHQGLESQGFVS